MSKTKTFVGHNIISKRYNFKTISYGNYIDYFQYSETITTYKDNSDRDYLKNSTGIKRKDSLSRAKQNIYRLNLANVDNKFYKYKTVFVTFTLKKPFRTSSIKKASLYLKSFRQKIKYNLGIKVQYLMVPEFQKDGTIHYHGLIYNLPKLDIPTWKNFWKFGSVDIQLVNQKKDKGGNSVENVSSYISKYISKDLSDKRLYGEKLFYTTRGLLRPIENYVDKKIDFSKYSDKMKVIQKAEFSQWIMGRKKIDVLFYKLKKK